MSQPEPSRGGIFGSPWVANSFAFLAIAVSVIGLIITTVKTDKALEISERSLKLSEDAVPEVRARAESYGMFVEAADPGVSAVIAVRTGLLNLGDEALVGCRTLAQPSTAEGEPVLYWPAVLEHRGETWTVSPGGSYTSDESYTLYLTGEVGRDAYAAVWFECETGGLVTAATLYGVDLATGVMLDGSMYGLQQLEPMGSIERATAIQERAGSEIPEIPEVEPFVLTEAE
ncbi:hypothetical protein [Agromyces humi]|uniref:hypothetical protein n=1 Tax=Agromyces humi TaxID=1766800 RepID=UPI001358B275|nr:hypothetical protein [Agromyces humi]